MTSPTRIAIILPGLHSINRGAERAFESIAHELGKSPDWKVTLFGYGHLKRDVSYEFEHVECRRREYFERWPKVAPMRSETTWEELLFVIKLRSAYDFNKFDVTLTCSYPFVNWFLRGNRDRAHRSPRHIFVTQNGDWPCRRLNAEYRFFGCDGLICINPEYYERHRYQYRTYLIPNGVDPNVFRPGSGNRSKLDIPDNAFVVLMVSALIPSKRVRDGIAATAKLQDAWMILAGDGVLRDEIDAFGVASLGRRFRRVSLSSEEMPALYQSADVVLHMSVDEPFGNVFTEALSTGLPVVAHDSPTTRWLLKDTSYFVDTKNLEEVADALRDVCKEPCEEKFNSRIRLVHNNYTWQSIAREYGAAIREIVES